ncbi:iron uptake porin [Tumidithrix elongata RA019]|uniref:Iron uptake porin n=1 Tax=Tumidithrix elongata BACA0141 TaxID=2716417 RepID=A0AAW9PZ90_9CYAN|nr:iron uptake porin [Tumidithrix elongata RA019]
MLIKNFQRKQGSQLIWLSTLVVSSTLLSTATYAETTVGQVNPKLTTDSSLIQAIGVDPMVQRPPDNRPLATGDSAVIQQIGKEQVSPPTHKTAQNVTSVSQLSDVRPTDWAFTALQSLVERYGCIAGYPDRTYRGQRALSRYEFAAGLNACLDKINEIISAGLADKVSKEDLAAVQKLQEEFAAELATLRGRIDALEAKTTKLEAQQFSTTTKLFGQAIFGLQGRFNNTSNIPRLPGANVPDPATNVTFGYQAQLSLVTQFPDRGILLTGLQASNLSTDAPITSFYALNNPFTRLGYEGSTGGTFTLSDLNYRFLASKNLAVIVGARGVNAINVFRGPNRFESAGNGPISLFAQRNPVISLNAGQAGLGFDWQISKALSLQGVYSAGNPASASGDGGLFGGPTSIGVQLAANLFERLDVTLYYLNSYTNNGTLNSAVGDTILGIVSPVPSNFSTNAFGGSLSWQATPNVNLGGWVGFTTSSIQNSGFSGSVETFNWMTFANLRDIFKGGDLFGLYIGQPPRITSSNLSGNINFPSILSGASGAPGGQPASTTHVEAFYRFPVSKNISITPGIVFVFNPGNTATSDTVTIGVLRTTFTF